MPGNHTVTDTCNPSAIVTGDAAKDDWYSYVNYQDFVYPITLSVPDPFGRPQQGDGSNQYVYDDTFPQGNLFINAVVSVPGASRDGTQWLVNGSDNPSYNLGPYVVKMDDPLQLTEKDTGPLPAAGQIGFQNYHLATPSPGMWFQGLPVNNSDPNPLNNKFGPHVANMMVGGQVADHASIQTFFTGVANNYPGLKTANGVTIIPDPQTDYTNSNPDPNLRFWTPNWYHYYNQAYTASGPYDTTGIGSQCDPISPHIIHIRDDASASSQMRVFTLDKNDPNAFVKYAGYIDTYGIWSYIAICAHEQGHFDAWQSQINISTPTQINDYLNHQWKALHHLDNTKADTTGAYIDLPKNGDIPDQEVIADIPALGAFFTDKALWKVDWASPSGLQWGEIADPIRNLVSTPTGPDMYTDFHPVIGGTKDTNWAYGTPVHVFNLADLQSNISPYVGGIVLTSLP